MSGRELLEDVVENEFVQRDFEGLYRLGCCVEHHGEHTEMSASPTHLPNWEYSALLVLSK